MIKVRREQINFIELILSMTPSFLFSQLKPQFGKMEIWKIILWFVFLIVLAVSISRCIILVKRKYLGKIICNGTDERLIIGNRDIKWDDIKKWNVKTTRAAFTFSGHVFSFVMGEYQKTIYIKTSKLIIIENAPKTLEKLFQQYTNTYDEDFKFEETKKTIVINLHHPF